MILINFYIPFHGRKAEKMCRLLHLWTFNLGTQIIRLMSYEMLLLSGYTYILEKINDRRLRVRLIFLIHKKVVLVRELDLASNFSGLSNDDSSPSELGTGSSLFRNTVFQVMFHSRVAMSAVEEFGEI